MLVVLCTSWVPLSISEKPIRSFPEVRKLRFWQGESYPEGISQTACKCSSSAAPTVGFTVVYSKLSKLLIRCSAWEKWWSLGENYYCRSNEKADWVLQSFPILLRSQAESGWDLSNCMSHTWKFRLSWQYSRSNFFYLVICCRKAQSWIQGAARQASSCRLWLWRGAHLSTCRETLVITGWGSWFIFWSPSALELFTWMSGLDTVRFWYSSHLLAHGR